MEWLLAWRVWVLLAAVFLTALGLRVVGIDFGLPHLYHPDEPAYVLQALAVARGLPRGVTFANPPLYKYVLVTEYAGTYGVGLLAGRYTSPKDFVTRFRADPSFLYLIARVTSALFGAVTVLAVYALAASLRGSGPGLLAASLQATAYLSVREAHFAVNDSLVALLVTLALIFCVRIVRGGTWRDYVVAGALVGLAFTAKYHGAAVALPFVLAHALRFRSDGSRDLALGCVTATAAVLVTFPAIVLETGRVLHDIYVHDYLPGRVGYRGLDASGGYLYYLKALHWGLGWPLALSAGAGVLLTLARHDRSLLVVAILPLSLYAFMGQQRLFFARFMLVAVPALVVLTTVAADSLVRAFAARAPRILSTVGLIAAGVLLGALPLRESVRFDLVLTRTDTRTEARTWLERHLPAGARVAIEAFPSGPALPPDQYDVIVAERHALFDLPVEEYRSRGVEYVIASSYSYESPLDSPSQEDKRRAFFATLAREADLLAEFRPYVGDQPLAFVYDQIYGPFTELDRLERPGPTIKVFRIRL